MLKDVRIKMVEEIKAALINSCINQDVELFLPYLDSPIVEISFPTKTEFKEQYTYMFDAIKDDIKGELILKIEKSSTSDEDSSLWYNFYDEYHIHSRLTIVVKKEKESISLDILPF